MSIPPQNPPDEPRRDFSDEMRHLISDEMRDGISDEMRNYADVLKEIESVGDEALLRKRRAIVQNLRKEAFDREYVLLVVERIEAWGKRLTDQQVDSP